MSNDHYVPQFYLRNFSPDVRRDDSEPKRIHLINIPRRQFIPNASIKNECKKAGFHGYQIGVEAALSQLEGSAASVIKNMFESGTPPAPQSHNHQVLAGFIAIQRSRTLYAAESADKNADRMFKVAYATDPRLSGINLSNYEIRSQYPVAIPLKVAAQCIPSAMQLGMHLFVSKAEEAFITSDNPVIAHNQYCEGIDYQGVLGWACSGIQILFPLSPRYLIMRYDTEVYAVGEKRGSGTSVITANADIKSLNSFQILAARNNIYFHDNGRVDFLLSQIHRLVSRRHIKRHITVESKPVPSGEGTTALVHQFEHLLPTILSLTSIRIKRSARRMPLDRRSNMARKPDRVANRVSGAGFTHRIYRAGRYYSD